MLTSNRSSGFTIVELLIVVIVIAILATISAVGFQGITTRASDTAQLAEVRQLSEWLEVKKIQSGSYPLAVQDASLMAQHNASSATFNMNYVVNRPAMSTIEQQKLASFESTHNIKVPMNTLVYSGEDPGASSRTMVFIMARFKDDKNIPMANRSHRLAQDSANDAFPQIIMGSSSCTTATITPQTVQTTIGGGNNVPTLQRNGVYLNTATVYRGLPGCGASQLTWYIRDTNPSHESGSTGLFVIKQP